MIKNLFKTMSPFSGIETMSLILVASVTLSRSAVNAQELGKAQASELWGKINQVDESIVASRSNWSAIFSTPTGPVIAKQEVERRVEQAEEKARQDGENEATVKQFGQVARRTSENQGKGFSAQTKLNFVRVGNTIRCEINFVEAKTRAIEFFDGQNSVFLETMVNGVEYSPRGQLRREAKEILSHSAPTWQMARFLTGIPFSQQFSPYNPTFSPKNTTLSVEKSGNLLLERRVDPVAGKSGIEFSALLRMTMSKENFRPLSYEVINLLYKGAKGGEMGRVDVSGYKRYANNIWFPSKIVVKTSAFRREYNLIKAEFNESVDPLELRLPPKTSIADSRFGSNVKAIRYQPKNGQIPTDDEVRKMLGIKTEKIVEEKTAETQVEEPKRTTSLSFAPGVGLLFLSMGMMLWSLSKKL